MHACTHFSRTSNFKTVSKRLPLSQVKRLVENGVSVTDSDYDKRTALHLASCEGRKDVVEFLMEHKADVHARDRSVIEYAVCMHVCMHACMRRMFVCVCACMHTHMQCVDRKPGYVGTYIHTRTHTGSTALPWTMQFATDMFISSKYCGKMARI
jgi:hypothetical protein